MADTVAVKDQCDHAWEYRKPAHTSASVRICSLCRSIDGEDLNRTLNEYAREYAKTLAPKPVSLLYGHSDGEVFSVVDRIGGIPESPRERALLRALLTFTLTVLDEREP